MDKQKLIERNKQKLAENIAETRRQSQSFGVRLGVSKTLDELERKRKRIARRLIEIDPEHKDEYSQYLY